MPKLHDLKDDDLQSLTPEAVAALAQQLLQRLRRQDSKIRFNDARIEKMTFELARLALLQRLLLVDQSSSAAAMCQMLTV